MSRKRKRTGRPRPAGTHAGKPSAARANVVWHQTAEEATLAHKPRFNGYACGHGAHGDAKYNRAKDKRAWRERGGQEGASRLLPFSLRRLNVRRVSASTWHSLKECATCRALATRGRPDQPDVPSRIPFNARARYETVNRSVAASGDTRSSAVRARTVMR